MSKRAWGGIVGTAALVASLAVSGTAGAASANVNHGRGGGAGGIAPTASSAGSVSSTSTGSGLATAGVAGGVATPAPAATADHSPVCGAVAAGYARCNSIELLNPAQNWRGTHVSPARPPSGSTNSTPSGYQPADLQAAYNIAGLSAQVGTTVAIVDAYDDPNAFKDVSTYRSTWGLPALTDCSKSMNTKLGSPGCFFKVNQSGGTSYPRGNSGWAEEISLDVDMVSAICPNCSILLVEASSNSFTNLGAAVKFAASKKTNGVVAISNSYGGGEFSSETSSTYDSPWHQSGVAVTVSSGDNGYGVEYPAANPYVTAVGGTTLAGSGSSWSETAWSGAGSGCSAYEPQPSWQTNLSALRAVCLKRAVADVSAEADPNTGVAVYDSYHEPGWMVFGGTSVASPIVASVYALAGNTTTMTDGSYSYGNTGSLHDIVLGSNGSCGNLLCDASLGSGWDGPTGNGTPNGTGAF